MGLAMVQAMVLTTVLLTAELMGSRLVQMTVTMLLVEQLDWEKVLKMDSLLDSRKAFHLDLMTVSKLDQRKALAIRYS